MIKQFIIRGHSFFIAFSKKEIVQALRIKND